jgi:hypothetical protein
VAQLVERCPGYWDRNLIFHKSHVWPQDAILDDMLEKLQPAAAGMR